MEFEQWLCLSRANRVEVMVRLAFNHRNFRRVHSQQRTLNPDQRRLLHLQDSN